MPDSDFLDQEIRRLEEQIRAEQTQEVSESDLSIDEWRLLAILGVELASQRTRFFDSKVAAMEFLDVLLTTLDCHKGGIFTRTAKGELETLCARDGNSSVDVSVFSRTRLVRALDSGQMGVLDSPADASTTPQSLLDNLSGPSVVLPLVAEHGAGSSTPFAAMCLVRRPYSSSLAQNAAFLRYLSILVGELLFKARLTWAAKDNSDSILLLSYRERLREKATDDAVLDAGPFASFVGKRSSAIRACLRQAEIAARHPNAPILLLGESGCGKDVLARAIHHHPDNPRRAKPFCAHNCSISGDTNAALSLLFGHLKGAYTGATSSRLGLFRAADGGTVFLDELTSMPQAVQAYLLRVLQDGIVIPMGADAPDTRDGIEPSFQADVRFICATNGDVKRDIAQGLFREDLFYRINTFTIVIPPLRERSEDIADLCSHFLTKYNGFAPRAPTGITAGALRLLQRHRWPGNVRELESAMIRLSATCIARQISADDVRTALMMDETEPEPRGKPHRSKAKKRKAPSKEVLLEALERNRWSTKATYESLGISRPYIYQLMKKYGIKRPRPESTSSGVYRH